MESRLIFDFLIISSKTINCEENAKNIHTFEQIVKYFYSFQNWCSKDILVFLTLLCAMTTNCRHSYYVLHALVIRNKKFQIFSVVHFILLFGFEGTNRMKSAHQMHIRRGCSPYTHILLYACYTYLRTGNTAATKIAGVLLIRVILLRATSKEAALTLLR